jgi:hypothetical protein
VCFGLEVVEVPVCVRYEDAASTTGLRTVARMIAELWRIRRAWRKRWRAAAASGAAVAAEEAVVLGPWPVGVPAVPVEACVADAVGGCCGR